MAWLRTQGPDTSIQTDILLHLRTFANQSRMRRLLLGLMAANLSGSEANRLLNQFYSMDSDFSGTIELQELARVTQQVWGKRGARCGALGTFGRVVEVIRKCGSQLVPACTLSSDENSCHARTVNPQSCLHSHPGKACPA